MTDVETRDLPSSDFASQWAGRALFGKCHANCYAICNVPIKHNQRAKVYIARFYDAPEISKCTCHISSCLMNLCKEG